MQTPVPRGSTILAVAVLIGAGAVAAATTRGQVVVPPASAGLIGLALVTAALAILAARPLRRGGAVVMTVVLVGLGLVGAQDYLRPGFTMGHDTQHHLWALWAVWRTVLDGDPTPRWIPYLGTGMPLLQFYSPLTFVFAAPAQAIGASAIGALKWLMVLAQVASSFSAYGASRWLGAGRAGGLVAAAALVLGPYHLLDQTVRCALAESLAFPILPWFLAAGWKVLAGEGARGPRVLAATGPILLLVHPLSVISGSMTLGLLAPLALFRGPSRWRRLRLFVVAGTLGAGVTAGWWLPIVFELPHTGVPAMTAGDASLAAMAKGVLEPVERHLWQGLGLPDPITGARDPDTELSIYFGCTWVALLVLAAVGPRGRPEGGDPRPWGLAGLALLLLASRPLSSFLALVPASDMLQFPWRLFGPATACAALGGGLAVSRWLGPRDAPSAGQILPASLRSGLVALILGLMALDAAPYLGSTGRLPEYQGMVRRFDPALVPVSLPRDRFLRIEEAWLPPADYGWRIAKTRRIFGEYLPAQLWPRYASRWLMPESQRELSQMLHVSYRFMPYREPLALEPLPYASLRPEGVDLALSGLDWWRSPERIQVELPASSPPGVLAVSESRMPGWQARVDDGPWIEPLSGVPLLATPVPAGARTVSFRYAFARPWYRAAGYSLSLVGLLFWVLPSIRRRLLS